MLTMILWGVIILIAGIIGLLIYFIPTLIAFKRGCRHRVAIALVNIIGGWVYGVAWVVALVWAALDEPG
ncbi:MAG: superinfection immunity protein [Deltaproteobacteria bacterium]|jgi:hypothetical protein|nr:superinfection immunity protein [Deltaproteobacteria bacterium]